MRHPHGSTRRPPNARPANGYGRPLRPGPAAWARPGGVGDLAAVDLDRELARFVAVDLVAEEAR